MDDYYGIVGVDRNASMEDVEKAVRKQLRLWQRRAGSADLIRRQEAERRVQQLGEARAILLDELARRRYDRQLDAHRTPPPPPAPPPRAAPPPLQVPVMPSSAPPPGPVVYPIPPAPPVPLPQFQSNGPLAELAQQQTRTYRHAPGAEVSLAVAPVFLLIATALGPGQPLGAFVTVLGAGAALVAAVFWQLGSRVVLSPRGIVLHHPSAQTIPWAQVYAIEPTEVAGVRRVGLHTVDGSRVLLPAPRGKRLIGRNSKFLVEVADMQRWHQHYAPR